MAVVALVIAVAVSPRAALRTREDAIAITTLDTEVVMLLAAGAAVQVIAMPALEARVVCALVTDAPAAAKTVPCRVPGALAIEAVGAPGPPLLECWCHGWHP